MATTPSSPETASPTCCSVAGMVLIQRKSIPQTQTKPASKNIWPDLSSSPLPVRRDEGYGEGFAPFPTSPPNPTTAFSIRAAALSQYHECGKSGGQPPSRRRMNDSSQRPNHTMSSLTCIPPTFESLEPRALLAAGAIDSSYSPPFNNVGNSLFAFESVVHMQFDGKSIHYAHINDKQTLWRQNPNGSLDTSFGTRAK